MAGEQKQGQGQETGQGVASGVNGLDAFWRVVVLLVVIGVMLGVGVGIKGCVAHAEWERVQVERCMGAGGVWSGGGEMGAGCYVPLVLE